MVTDMMLFIIFLVNKMNNTEVEITMKSLINFLKVIDTPIWEDKSEYFKH